MGKQGPSDLTERELNARNQDRFRIEAEKKQEVSLAKERKRLQLLEELKEYRGPFTNDKEVDR